MNEEKEITFLFDKLNDSMFARISDKKTKRTIHMIEYADYLRKLAINPNDSKRAKTSEMVLLLFIDFMIDKRNFKHMIPEMANYVFKFIRYNISLVDIDIQMRKIDKELFDSNKNINFLKEIIFGLALFYFKIPYVTKIMSILSNINYRFLYALLRISYFNIIDLEFNLISPESYENRILMNNDSSILELASLRKTFEYFRNYKLNLDQSRDDENKERRNLFTLIVNEFKEKFEKTNTVLLQKDLEQLRVFSAKCFKGIMIYSDITYMESSAFLLKSTTTDSSKNINTTQSSTTNNNIVVETPKFSQQLQHQDYDWRFLYKIYSLICEKSLFFHRESEKLVNIDFLYRLSFKNVVYLNLKSIVVDTKIINHRCFPQLETLFLSHCYLRDNIFVNDCLVDFENETRLKHQAEIEIFMIEHNKKYNHNFSFDTTKLKKEETNIDETIETIETKEQSPIKTKEEEETTKNRNNVLKEAFLERERRKLENSKTVEELEHERNVKLLEEEIKEKKIRDEKTRKENDLKRLIEEKRDNSFPQSVKRIYLYNIMGKIDLLELNTRHLKILTVMNTELVRRNEIIKKDFPNLETLAFDDDYFINLIGKCFF